LKKLIALAVLTLSTSFASTIAMVTSGGGAGFNSVDSYTTGWSFTLSDFIAVTSLGFYDVDQDGLDNTHDVGIFDSTGTLLVSATVPSGTAGTLNAGFRMVSITPFALGPGSYVIGGFSDASTDGILVDPLFITAPGITTIDTGVYDYGSTLVFPGTSTSSEGPPVAYASVNFEFDEVPEPSTLLLSITAFAAVGLKKRFSRNA
jgi:hypothetical protein